MTTTAEVAGTARSPRSLWMPVAVMVALLGVGYYPTRLLCGEAAAWAMVAAVGVVAATVHATSLHAVRRMPGSDAATRLRISLRAATIRMALTIAVSGVVAWKAWVEPGPFLVWVAISYVLLIKIETVLLLRGMRQDEKRT